MKIKLSTLKRMIKEAYRDTERGYDSHVGTWNDDTGRARSVRHDRGSFGVTPNVTRAGAYRQARAREDYQGYSPDVDDPDFAGDVSGFEDIDAQDYETYASSFDDDADDHPDIGMNVRNARRKFSRS